MASANLKKYGTNAVCYGLAKHNFRDGKNHSNPDIDPTRTHRNRHYGPQTSEEYRERFRNMIKECDEKHPPKRKKADRKTYLGINIPSPREGMSPEDEARWSAKTWEVMTELFPGQVIGATYHADEIHKYLANDEEHISRGHTHYGLIPWTDDKGLNMDAFYKRDLPNRINEALDKACMEMFGFPYRDGTGKKSNKTVEELKHESKIAALENKIQSANDNLKTIQIFEMEKQATIKSLDAKIESKRKEAEEIYKPFVDAQERLLKQFEALTPKQREKERTTIEELLKESKRAPFGDPDKMRKATAALKKESERIEADYFSVDSDEDFGLD